LAVVVAVLGFGVFPLLGDVGSVLDAARAVRPGWFVLGASLEVASIVAYAMFTRSLLPMPGRPPLHVLARIDLTTWGAGHVLPGGPAGTAALRFRLLTARGVDRSGALMLAAVQGTGSAMVLHLILWVALLVAIPVYGGSWLYGLAAVVGLVATLGVLAGLLAALKGRERGLRILRWVAAQVPALDADRVDRQMQALVRHLRRIGHDHRQLAVAASWAALNWLLDAAALWVFLLAFGHPVGVIGLLVAFGLASVLAVLPITPGGLGVVEGVLVPTLIAFGVPGAPALLAVLGWRVVNFWLPVPAAGLSYLSLRVRHAVPATCSAPAG
ncbi:flippase-like domain-containing protein, partial [Pseudonocardia sp. KRD-182]|uniref:lysylphosphatidylglycerol synthase transmembrane domain-containing protein n=1 Tax=Pseudonocardia oceani TaxID=2792013 RepID=UPI001C4A613F